MRALACALKIFGKNVVFNFFYFFPFVRTRLKIRFCVMHLSAGTTFWAAFGPYDDAESGFSTASLLVGQGSSMLSVSFSSGCVLPHQIIGFQFFTLFRDPFRLETATETLPRIKIESKTRSYYSKMENALEIRKKSIKKSSSCPSENDPKKLGGEPDKITESLFRTTQLMKLMDLKSMNSMTSAEMKKVFNKQLAKKYTLEEMNSILKSQLTNAYTDPRNFNPKFRTYLTHKQRYVVDLVFTLTAFVISTAAWNRKSDFEDEKHVLSADHQRNLIERDLARTEFKSFAKHLNENAEKIAVMMMEEKSRPRSSWIPWKSTEPMIQTDLENLLIRWIENPQVLPSNELRKILIKGDSKGSEKDQEMQAEENDKKKTAPTMI